MKTKKPLPGERWVYGEIEVTICKLYPHPSDARVDVVRCFRDGSMYNFFTDSFLRRYDFR